MDSLTSPVPDPANDQPVAARIGAASDQSVAARIGVAIAAAVASSKFGQSTSSKNADKDRVKISFLVPRKMEQAFRYIALQLELRNEAIHTQQDLLHEMLRAFLNFFATDKTMAHQILRNMKPPQS